MQTELGTWELQPHTEAKHALMRHYFGAWYAIVGPAFPHVAYFDGFAGPGRYKDGQKGSPLIALDEFLKRGNLRENGRRYSFLFNEPDDRTRRELNGHLADYCSRLPKNAKFDVKKGEFVDAFRRGLEGFEALGLPKFKPLVIVDPFGLKQAPMEIVRQVMGYPGAEVLFTFMYDTLNRLNSQESIGDHTDSTFGGGAWRRVVDQSVGNERYVELVALYKDRLLEAGAKFVLDFTVEKTTSGKYAIIFATKHLRGCHKMKEAMWKVDPSGAFTYTRRKRGQIHMGAPLANFDQLTNDIELLLADGRFRTIEEVNEFMEGDGTGYLPKHLRKQALIPMEKTGMLEVVRRGTHGFPAGTRVRLKS